MKTQRTPIRTATGAALLAIITVALAAGCYWTPQEQTGGISIAVDTGALSASAAGESSISASATGDADTFLLAFVIAESLLRGDPTAAESALENVNVAWQDELSSFVQAQINGTAVETGISTIDVGTDLVKAQVGFFSAGTGGGGTSSFSGLRAGERYLVVIAGSSSASQQEELFGFESVTIAGGETPDCADRPQPDAGGVQRLPRRGIWCGWREHGEHGAGDGGFDSDCSAWRLLSDQSPRLSASERVLLRYCGRIRHNDRLFDLRVRW